MPWTEPSAPCCVTAAPELFAECRGQSVQTARVGANCFPVKGFGVVTGCLRCALGWVLGCDVRWALTTSAMNSALQQARLPSISLAQDRKSHERVRVRGRVWIANTERAASFAVVWKAMRIRVGCVHGCLRSARTGHYTCQSRRPTGENSRVGDARRERLTK